jgi:hypothetical protein
MNDGKARCKECKKVFHGINFKIVKKELRLEFACEHCNFISILIFNGLDQLKRSYRGNEVIIQENPSIKKFGRAMQNSIIELIDNPAIINCLNCNNYKIPTECSKCSLNPVFVKLTNHFEKRIFDE